MYRRILLALDGSAMAEQALPVAVNHAKKFQSVLYLIRVINPLSKSYRTGMASISAIQKAEEQLRVIAEDYLDGIANKLKEDNVEVNIATRIGIPYKEITRFSDQNNIDLIVMCTRGESGFTRWMLGSNTDYVIRGTNVPVLAVPATEVKIITIDALEGIYFSLSIWNRSSEKFGEFTSLPAPLGQYNNRTREQGTDG